MSLPIRCLCLVAALCSLQGCGPLLNQCNVTADCSGGAVCCFVGGANGGYHACQAPARDVDGGLEGGVGADGGPTGCLPSL
jgi:hypothetical protein